MADRVSEVKLVVVSLMLEIIIGLVAEPMSPVVAVRLMLAPVMVMAVVLVIVSREREKVVTPAVTVNTQVSVPFRAVVQELTSLVTVRVVVMVAAPVPYI